MSYIDFSKYQQKFVDQMSLDYSTPVLEAWVTPNYIGIHQPGRYPTYWVWRKAPIWTSPILGLAHLHLVDLPYTKGQLTITNPESLGKNYPYNYVKILAVTSDLMNKYRMLEIL